MHQLRWSIVIVGLTIINSDYDVYRAFNAFPLNLSSIQNLYRINTGPLGFTTVPITHGNPHGNPHTHGSRAYCWADADGRDQHTLKHILGPRYGACDNSPHLALRVVIRISSIYSGWCDVTESMVTIIIKSKQILFAQNTSHLNAASGKSSWWAGPTRPKRALTLTLNTIAILWA